MKKILMTFALGALGVLSLTPTYANSSFPDRVITIVAPYAAGGASDVAARLVAEQMAQDTGFNIIVENKPGAGGGIAASYVARAKPDGYTLLLGTSNTNGVNTYMYPNLSYDAVKSFTPVGMMTETVLVLLALSSFPADNLEQTIELIAANPDKYSYASPGVGTAHHLAMSLLEQKKDLKIMHVPYKGAGAAIVDLVSGTVPFMIGGIAPARIYIDSGKVKVIGAANDRKFASLPEDLQYFGDVAEGTAMSSWLGLLAPANTPEHEVNVLSHALETALQSKELQKRLEDQGLQAQYMGPKEFEKTIVESMPFWEKAVQSAGAGF